MSDSDPFPIVGCMWRQSGPAGVVGSVITRPMSFSDSPQEAPLSDRPELKAHELETFANRLYPSTGLLLSDVTPTDKVNQLTRPLSRRVGALQIFIIITIIIIIII